MSSETRDALGLRPYGEALHTAVRATVDGASAFLGRICLPAAEEFGLLLRDRVAYWRALNAAKIAQIAEAKLKAVNAPEDVNAHPRLVGVIIDQGSWTDSDEVQGMWAGLLASSCTVDGKDEENLLFVNFLQQLTSSQAKILSYACSTVKKTIAESGLIWPEEPVHCSADRLRELSGIGDVHRLDRELDHLRAIGLIEGGFGVHRQLSDEMAAEIAPTALALNMYVRCQGSRQSPVDFFGLSAQRPQQGTA